MYVNSTHPSVAHRDIGLFRREEIIFSWVKKLKCAVVVFIVLPREHLLQILKHKSVCTFKKGRSNMLLSSVFTLYCLHVQYQETSVALMSSLIKRHSVCLFLSSASSSKVLTTQRHNIDIRSKSRQPPSLPLCLYLQLSISVFLNQPPISASNIFSPHCWYSGRLLSWCNLIQIFQDLLRRLWPSLWCLVLGCLSIIVRQKQKAKKPRRDGTQGQVGGEAEAKRMQRTIRVLSLAWACCCEELCKSTGEFKTNYNTHRNTAHRHTRTLNLGMCLSFQWSDLGLGT